MTSADRRRSRHQRGQATVELVLVLPVVVLALLLVLQVGLVVRAQVLVVGAAARGARAAAVDGTSSAAQDAARRMPGIDASRVQVDADVGAPGDLAHVRVRYSVPTDVPLVGALLGEPVVSAESTMRVEGPVD